ncbi:MAG: AAA family ATPase [Eubacteriales bacterium]
MRIKRMTGRFGRLAGDSLNLGPGLNIVIGGNEGGKTTWSGFIRTMLYGMDSVESQRYNQMSDVSRFTPWDGGALEGEMLLSWDNDTVVLQRSEKDGKAFEEFVAYSELSGDRVPELDGHNCGEALVGASEDVFLRSAFIGHGGNLAVHSAPDLERRMAALVSTGHEDVTYAQVDELLGTWLRRRRQGQNGMIPKLEEEETLARRNRKQIGDNRETLNILVKREQELSTVRSALDSELEIYRKIERQENNRAFGKAKIDLEETEIHMENLLRQREKFTQIPATSRLLDLEDLMNDTTALEPEIRQIEQAIRQVEDKLDDAEERGADDRFPNMTSEEALRQIATDLQEVEELEEKLSQKTGSFLKSAGFGLICGLAVASGALASPDHETLFAIVAATCFVAMTAVGMMVNTSANRRREDQLEETYEFYQVKHAQEMREVGNRYSAVQDEIATLQSQVNQSYQGLEEMRRRQKDSHFQFINGVKDFAPDVNTLHEGGEAISRALRLEEQLKKTEDLLAERKKRYEELLAKGGEEYITLEELTPPETPREELEREKAFVDREYEEINGELMRLKGQQESLGEMSALAAREKAIQKELERRRKEHRALIIARKGLQRAQDILQDRFYPELNRLAGEYFSRLTGGKYKTLSLTRELEAFASPGKEEGETRRPVFALSQGTVDQVYLAVRLAVADLCLSKGELCPIILDDALVSFDQIRMENALDMLAEMGEKRQIILFSCHGREGKYMANHPKTRVIAI